MKPSFHSSAGRPRGAFALVVTLLILSLLVIVSVSYLSSMSAERQTADAYDSKVVAEQAAQTGVDNATAMLAQSFRDFPDSATVWDTAQTLNAGSPYNASVIVGGTNNEGTSLYLRAVPSSSDSSAYAVALPHGTLNAADGTPYPSNDSAGNDPNNPACKTFVLPLISGVPNGQAKLVSVGTPNPPATAIFPAKMNLGVSDPVTQNWTDLNVRRFGKNAAYPNGDIQGIIGSPPAWNGVGPKPARAYWINLKGSNNLVTGRYAFWIEDESFRANNNLFGSATQPPDNVTRPVDTSTTPAKPRLELPGDLTLAGPLTAANNSQPANTASGIVSLRTLSYPGGFFPDPLAFSHAFDSTTASGLQTIDTLRYLTTNQSSALNLSRHGSQRLNLNTAIFTPSATSTPAATTPAAVTAAIQKQVDALVQTLEFHLPYFGERFYRTNANSLNDATQVPGSPYAGAYQMQADGLTPVTDSSHSQIYYYKIAANIRDYVDTDSQPTMIGSSPAGAVMGVPGTPPLYTSGANEIWAQGKECTPYIQEVAVRYRPVVSPNSDHQSTYNYNIQADYYIEFWNMSDHDITARQMCDSSGNGPTVWVKDQQTWAPYDDRDSLQPDPTAAGESLTSNYPPADTQIDLLNFVKDRTGNSSTDGVVFKAGAVTVVTTDPQCASYTYRELTATGGQYGTPNPAASIPATTNVFQCQIKSGSGNGSRLYTGIVKPQNPTLVTARSIGIRLGRLFENTVPFTGTEVSLINSQGYFDVVRGAITKTGTAGRKVYIIASDTASDPGSWRDFSYGSSMMGNVRDGGGGPVAGNEAPAVSQLGDPRTNNEQLNVWVSGAAPAGTTAADGTRFMASTRTLGSLNYTGLQPDTTVSGEGWSDYYKFPSGTNHPSPDATTAPGVVAGTIASDGPMTSIGQLGDVFDPVRSPSTSPASTSVAYSHGGGRTFKIGQHDDLYSNVSTANTYPPGVSSANTADSVSASNNWASWRLTDVFDVTDQINLPGRININGIMRDKGAALLAALQGFAFQPATTSGTSDAVVHGDASSGLASASLDTTGSNNGFAQIIAQMTQRLDAVNVTPQPFFERGEFGEIGYDGVNSSLNHPLFGTTTTNTNNSLVASVDMNKASDHGREEMFRRLAQMICTRGNTFTAYTVGQSIVQTNATGPLKITGTQRMRVTFRLVPKIKDSAGAWVDFHPGYATRTSNGVINRLNIIDPASTTMQPLPPTDNVSDSPASIGLIPRSAKPDRYDVQILQVVSY